MRVFSAHICLLKPIYQHQAYIKTTQVLVQATQVKVKMNPVVAEPDKNEIIMTIIIGQISSSVLINVSFLREPSNAFIMLKTVA